MWCPDWSVVAALEEAEKSPALPRRRAARQRRRGVQRPRPGRGRTPRAAPPRRPGPVPRAGAAARQPRPRRPCLRAGPGHRRGPASRGGGAASRACSPSGRPAAGTAPRPTPPRRSARPWSRAASGTCGSASPTTSSPPSRPLAPPTRSRGWSSPPAGPRRSCAACPSTCCRTTGRAGGSWSACCSGSASARSATSPTCRATAVEHRLGAYGAAVRRRARGEDRALFAARTPPPELDAEVPFEPPLDSVEAITFSVRTTAERFVAQLAHHQLVATGCASRPSPTASSARRAPGCTRATSAPATSSTGCTGSCSRPTSAGSLRARKDSGAVRAPIDRIRFVPEVVEPAAAHGEALWGSASDDLVERGVARVQGMVGFDAVRRPVLQGGRSPSARQALVPWGERAVDLRPVDRPWPGRVPGPAPVRVFATPPAAEVVDDAGRDVCVTDRGVVTGEPRRFRVGGGGAALAAGDRVGRAVAHGRGLVVGRGRAVGPLPGRRRRRARLAAAARPRTAGPWRPAMTESTCRCARGTR